MSLYPGPCAECCACDDVYNAFVSRYPSLSVVISGSSICSLFPFCTNVGGSDQNVTAKNISGAFTLANAGLGHWKFTVPDGVKIETYSSTDGSCSGSVISTVNKAYTYDVSIQCVSTITGYVLTWNLEIISDYGTGTIPFIGPGADMGQPNANGQTCASSGAPSSGGTATLGL